MKAATSWFSDNERDRDNGLTLMHGQETRDSLHRAGGLHPVGKRAGSRNRLAAPTVQTVSASAGLCRASRPAISRNDSAVSSGSATKTICRSASPRHRSSRPSPSTGARAGAVSARYRRSRRMRRGRSSPSTAARSCGRCSTPGSTPRTPRSSNKEGKSRGRARPRLHADPRHRQPRQPAAQRRTRAPRQGVCAMTTAQDDDRGEGRRRSPGRARGGRQDGRSVNWELVEPFVEIDPRPRRPAAEQSRHARRGHHRRERRSGARRQASAESGRARRTPPTACARTSGSTTSACSAPTLKETEFAIIAALQYIRYLNERNSFITIHGANLSLSIPHDVRNYACGRTPVCNECERLVEQRRRRRRRGRQSRLPELRDQGRHATRATPRSASPIPATPTA